MCPRCIRLKPWDQRAGWRPTRWGAEGQAVHGRGGNVQMWAGGGLVGGEVARWRGGEAASVVILLYKTLHKSTADPDVSSRKPYSPITHTPHLPMNPITKPEP